MKQELSPFEEIRRTTFTGNEFWSSRDFANVLGYTDYRNFESVIEKARVACFTSGQRVEDHFVEITEMVEIGSGAKRPLRSYMLSRYACYLVVQNADPSKEIVALGQTYFAVQTRRQELTDQQLEDERILVVEYKGAHLVSASDAQEKRDIGNLWAARSNGRCLFVMPSDKQFREICEKIAK